jgi:predicted GTPase
LEGRSRFEDEEEEGEEDHADEQGPSTPVVAAKEAEDKWKGQSVKISIVGKPNVGKNTSFFLHLTP